MDQARVDAFLDDGWCLIGQLHRWLSKWPRNAYDRVELVDLITQLQSLWSSEDDLGLIRLARTTLALEQLLERFCSRTLEFNAERLADLTAAIEVFQDLLLGFEATREEPTFTRLDPIIRLEHHARRPHRSDIVVSEIKLIEEPIEPSATLLEPGEGFGSRIANDSPLARVEATKFEPTIQPSVISMLEQFVTKLDDTCHRLHARMLADETPYATTTSRLEYLSQATRDLVEQIARAVQAAANILPVELAVPSQDPLVINDQRPLLVAAESPLALTPPTVLPRLVETTREIPRLPQLDSISMAATVIRQTGLEHSVTKSRRILILEESLFYRHFVSIALELAGFEPVALETVHEGRAALGPSSEFGAVLVSSKAACNFADVIDESRQQQHFKVVLLTTSSNAETDSIDVDERVSISHPQRLIAILERLLGHSPHGIRRPA